MDTYMTEYLCQGHRTTLGVSPLLLPYGSWGLNSGHCAWWHTPLPAELSYQSLYKISYFDIWKIKHIGIMS